MIENESEFSINNYFHSLFNLYFFNEDLIVSLVLIKATNY